MSILDTSLPYSRGVNIGHELLRVRAERPVEELFIPVLQAHKIYVPLQWVLFSAHLLHDAHERELLIDDRGREQAAKVQPVALLLREAR